MSKKLIELKKCPFCGGEARLTEFYESCDGRGDRHAKITCCKCEITMYLTFDEFYDAQKEFGYTGGYYSQNKAYWDGMHQKLIDKWNTRTPVDKMIERLEQQAQQYRRRCNEHVEKGFVAMGDKYLGKACSYEHAIEIIKELM